MLNRFGERIDELESVVREIAIEITTGTFVERLPPEKVWEKTGRRIDLVGELIRELREYLAILRPEKVPTIQLQVTKIYERLGIFQDKFKHEVGTPVGIPPVSIDDLRQALVEISEFVSLCRAVKTEPSEVIGTILELREDKRTEEFSLTELRIQRLGDLVREAQASQRLSAEANRRLENQLESLRSEYESLLASLYKKTEE